MTISSELQAYAASHRSVWAADLYTITTVQGLTVNWSGSDIRLLVGSTWFELGPVIKRGQLRWRLGLEVDSLGVTLAPRTPTDLFNGVPLLHAVRRGDFAGADFRLDRGFAATPGGTWLDIVPRIVGNIGKTSVDGLKASFEVRSKLALLDVPFPRNTYVAACDNTLFDSVCALNPASFAASGTVTSVVSQTAFNLSVSESLGAHQFGRLRFDTGANAGRSQTIKAAASTLVTFTQPWPAPIAVGDAFTWWPGCDKKRTTCLNKFSNLARFRGTPFIPAPETTV